MTPFPEIGATMNICFSEATGVRGITGLSKVRRITMACAEEFGVPYDQILSKQRQANIVRARHAAMYLAQMATRFSLSQLGAIFDRDHTTVLHAVRRAHDEIRRSSEYRDQINAVREAVNA